MNVLSQLLDRMFKVNKGSSNRARSHTLSATLFSVFDSDNNGTHDWVTIGSLLVVVGTGVVDFDEFVAGISIVASGSWEDRLQLAFDAFDK